MEYKGARTEEERSSPGASIYNAGAVADLQVMGRLATFQAPLEWRFTVLRRLDLLDIDEVNALLNLQRLAYRVEADLIGFYDIPPLKDTIQSLQSCNEVFYGYFEEAGLFGAISYTKQVDEIDICRLVVHPKAFRQGVGRALLAHLLATENDATRFKVSSGQKSTSAIKLYEQYGFTDRYNRDKQWCLCCSFRMESRLI